MRNIKKGDEVVVGRTDDGTNGVFVHCDGFHEENEKAKAAKALPFAKVSQEPCCAIFARIKHPSTLEG